MRAIILIIFAICLAGTVKAQEQTINTNVQVGGGIVWQELAEEGVFELKDGTIAVVESSLNGFKGRKALRKKALKQLTMWKEWNDNPKLKQINERFRGASPGVGPKLTMIFKRVQ